MGFFFDLIFDAFSNPIKKWDKINTKLKIIISGLCLVTLLLSLYFYQ